MCCMSPRAKASPNALNTAVCKGLKSAGRADLWTFHDPAVRLASSYGNSSDQIKRLRANLNKAIKATAIDGLEVIVPYTLKLTVIGEDRRRLVGRI